MLLFACVAPPPDDPPDREVPLVTSPPLVASPPDLPPNVLLVVVDDIGLDKLGRYGVHPDVAPTPTFDRLADEGLLFRNAYALPTCTATRGALMTGRHARRTGTSSIIWPFDTTWELPLEEQTLAERLALAPVPYTTAMVGKWHLASNVSPSATAHPTLQGFVPFVGSLNNLWVDSAEQDGGHNYFHWEKVLPDGGVVVADTYATTDTTDDALRLLAVLPEPFLLVVSYNAAHNVWHVPPEHLHSFGEPADGFTRQLAMIEALDTELGRLVDRVPEDTLLVLIGDNGTPDDVTTPPSLRLRAKGTVYEGGVRVPMLVRGPGVPAGAETEALFSVVDLLPTLSEVAGIGPDDHPGAGPLDGASQVAVLQDPAASVRDEVYVEHLDPTGPGPWDEDERALRDERFKLRQGPDGEYELFDLLGRPFDEGPDLLAGPLDAEAQAAFDRLVVELEERVAALGADLP